MDNFKQKINEIEQYAKENYIPIIRKQSAKLLVDMIKKNNPQNVLEIGTAIGYSGILILLASEEVKLTTMEKDEERIVLAKQNFESFNLTNRVDIISGDANEELKKLSNMYDFIFLDGPKSHYGKQLPYLLNHLNKNGVIFADNVLFMGEILSNEMPKHKHRTAILNMRRFLETVKNDKNLESELINIEDGILIIRKK